jgi:signal transduction histidine kinase
MSNTLEIQKNPDLAFFGRINASISHELKNIFAIISEAAGLLNDLVELSEKGKKIDTGMFKTCSRDIEEEIQRGFATVKEMNAFSHSVDRSLASVSLVNLVNLMINIAGYLSYACKVRITAPDPADLEILTCPFRLQHIIYQALVFAFKRTGPEGEFRISILTENDSDVRIAFSDLGNLSDENFPFDHMAAVVESIHARIRVTEGFRSFDIVVPKSIA